MRIIKYIGFAIIAIFVNLYFQFLAFKLQSGSESLLVAMLCGTLAGLITKYLLDKRFIFDYVAVNNIDQARSFILYSLGGIFTTFIFWATEITFHIFFEDPKAKYLGAFIGLSIGYSIKYFLDKRYVFNSQEDYYMSKNSWGMHPKINSKVFNFDDQITLKKIINDNNELIPFGNGRSYGDSALSTNIIDLRNNKEIIDFQEDTGILHVQSGVLLSEIIDVFIPKGWFLSVTPGTKYITVGGAIASDIHGKNHHIDGCFSEFIKEFKIMLADGSIEICSKDILPDLFKATCGGQGLTGIILDAKIYLRRIKSQYIDQVTIKTKNLKETFEAFEKYNNKPYSVAWIDCFAEGDNVGKSLIKFGDFKNDGNLNYKVKKRIYIPFNFPSLILNKWSVKVFNWLYFNKIRMSTSRQTVGIDAFFYPLDSIGRWNRIYGKKGFTQYQFILPKEYSYDGLNEILSVISKSGKGSFLAVLKLYGESNDNYLSFPMKGYSLALDFKIEKGLSNLLRKLDRIVIKYHGRIYLSKDVRITKDIFEKGYPKINVFRKFREENGMDKKFQSLQSKRVGI